MEMLLEAMSKKEVLLTNNNFLYRCQSHIVVS